MIECQRCQTVEEAMRLVAAVVAQQAGGDSAYFGNHRRRFEHTIRRILTLLPPPRVVLDLGSHYLHQSALLSLLGYRVFAVDVPVFADAVFLRERAAALHIAAHASTALASGEFLADIEETFDLVLCTEVLEHLTFNPVSLWRRVWQLLSDGGIIYLTTPNALRPKAWAKALIRLASFEGVGIPVDEVLNGVTYGHHWKEYSPREVRRYFRTLSPDFIVETRLCSYRSPGLRNNWVLKVIESVPVSRPTIEAIIRAPRKTAFKTPPLLPMLSHVSDAELSASVRE